MGLFGKAAANIAVVDIRSSSVGAAYVSLVEGALPGFVYSVRVPIDPHATEPLEEALPRTLEKALQQLSTDGAPVLRNVSGKGSVDKVLVTFTAPWQTSRVFSSVMEEDKPFLFTKQALSDSMEEQAEETKGRTRVSDMVIATLLNGYEVENPFGKRVKRAELIMLSSSLPDDVLALVTKQVRKALHQHHIEFNAFMPEAFVAMRDLYEHQRDFLVMDIGNEATDILLVKHGLLISTSSMLHGIGEITRAARGLGVSSPSVPLSVNALVDTTRNSDFASKVAVAEGEWVGVIRSELDQIAKQEPLPRTVFLLAEENVRDFLRRLLDAPELRTLWLSDEALAIMPVLPVHFASQLAHAEGQDVDPPLALLALAAAKRFG
jgi:hypothetical protein